MHTESFANLIQSIDAGDREQAAVQIFCRFTERLIALARTRLSDRIKQKVDPEDVVQSVYRSFFRRQDDGQFTYDAWEPLWGLLTMITLRKCTEQADRFGAAKRDVQRELRATSNGEIRIDLIDKEPTPFEATALSDTVESVMVKLDQREREIFSMTLQGLTVQEISNNVTLSERTVHRVRKSFRAILQQMLHDEASP